MTQIVTTTASPTPSDTLSSSAGQSESATTDSTEPIDSPTAPTPLGPSRANSTLTLTDFFSADSTWTEGSYDVADHKGIQGIMGEVNTGCYGSGSRRLELRLEDLYRVLSFQVGQSNDSARSDQTLVVDVLANNRQVLSRKIPFNVLQPFSLSVSGVNSLVLSFHLDSQDPNCGGSVNAVLFKPVLG